MPELPEVQNIIEDLRPKISGKIIKGAQILSCRPGGNEYRLLDLVGNHVIRTVSRKGKCIIFELSEGYKLLFHLGMTGQLLFRKDDGRGETDSHTRVVFFLDGNDHLVFNDMRRFGWIELQPRETKTSGYVGRLGADALTIDSEAFKRTVHLRKRTIKGVLLDQSVISGIGNIYADESLFEAGIHPLRRADTLTETELNALYQAIRTVLKKAISYGGSTVKDYKLPDGSSGSFQNQHKVYQRAGKACLRCGAKIIRLKVSGRGTCVCLKCQD